METAKALKIGEYAERASAALADDQP